MCTTGTAVDNILYTDDCFETAPTQIASTGVAMAKGHIAYSPDHERYVYFGGTAAATTNTVGYSNDGGETWTGVVLPDLGAFTDGGTAYHRTGIYDPVNKRFFGMGNRTQTTGERHYYSNDGITWVASTWNSLPADVTAGTDMAHDGKGNSVYCGKSFDPASKVVTTSSDGGVNITYNEGPTGITQLDAIGYMPATDTFLTCDASTEVFGRSTDAGLTWTTFDLSPPHAWGSYTKTITYDPWNPTEWLMVVQDTGGSGLWEVKRSTDDGATWSVAYTLTAGSFRHGHVYDEANGYLVFPLGNDGSIQRWLRYDGTAWEIKSYAVDGSVSVQGMAISYDTFG